MSTKHRENNQDDTPSVLRHLIKWRPLYELAAVVSVVVAIVFGGISINQTQKALDVAINSLALSNKSVEIQEKEFSLRNRPIVVAGSHQLDGPAGDSTEKKFPRSVKVHLVNISDIPATQVQGTFEVKLNGNTIGVSSLSPTAVAKNTTRTLALGLTEDLYKEAINPANKFETTIELTYSGMLGEKSDQYMTRVIVYWSSQDEHFIDKETLYK
jgi:hypothetical protein